jgi:hypothetical protein
MPVPDAVCVGSSRFIYDPALALGYNQAQEYCSRTYGAGGHLAYISSPKEQAALLAWIAGLKLPARAGYFESGGCAARSIRSVQPLCPGHS